MCVKITALNCLKTVKTAVLQRADEKSRSATAAKAKRNRRMLYGQILNSCVNFILKERRGNQMEYTFCDETVVCKCKSGEVFLIDAGDLETIRPYNWFFHNGVVEGNLGGKGKRVTLARTILGVTEKRVFVRQKIKNNDYRKQNLYKDNEYIDKGDYYEVVSQRGTFLIDKEDKTKIQQWHWRINTQNYAEAIINGERILLHRMLKGLPGFEAYEEVIDHINRNRLDNRKSNLRIVTQRENTRNGSGCPGRTSGIPGIYYCRSQNRWRGIIRVGDSKYDIGLHKTKEEALDEALRCIETVDRGLAYTHTSHVRPSSTGEKYIYRASSGYAVRVRDKYIGFSRDLQECVRMRDDYLSHN
jgi:hypothetical protein